MMKTINRKAPVISEKQIIIQASPERVWDQLSNIDQWAKWQKEIKQSKLLGALEAGSSFEWKSGGVKIRSTLHTAKKPGQLGWSGKSMGIYAIHNWTLIDEGGHTRLTVSESMEGILARLFSRTLTRTLESGLDAWLNNLQKALA